MLKVGIIIGSTRPGRQGEAVARWAYEIASPRSDAEFQVVDIKDFNLPLLDEPMPPIMGQYTKPHTKAWAAKIDSFDAYIFVTPEYNHGIPASLKNAIDFLYREWNNKRLGLSLMAALAECAPWRTCGWYSPRCRWPRCARKLHSPFTRIGIISLFSSPVPGTKPRSPRSSTRCLPGPPP